ncbi:TraR/DksA family transcriptional regulator [Roseimicrobium gellanilyticum]|uniref:TraR/DksA family transcriptional regulator n=1 Tax=Roseimicrobium gellanilyticum TaxID=748857 RepID=A0A366HVC3_9BACT|nr:TraR/DksA C4-type zinc finger protein [Roseimicrobium gellanilyticum]RBP48047.1 TraR/DksA family transcriptional regulator [Roseimicrobium gellanilyticum]
MAKKPAKTTAKPSKSAKAAKPKAPAKKAVVKKTVPKASAKKPAPAPKKAATAPKKSATSAKHPTVKGKPQSPDVKSKKKEPAKPAAPASKSSSSSSSSSSKTTKAAKTPTPAAKPAPAPAPAPAAKTNGNTKSASKSAAPAKAPAPAPQYSPLPKVIKQSPLEASADLVLKPAYNPKKLPPFFKKQHQRLIELRSALSDLMEGMAKETLRSRPEGSDASVGGMHMGDAGSDAYDRDFALSMLTKEQDALYEINEALERMDRGVYGLCELSGKKIPEERLEALPYTRYTREMQEQIERDQMGGKFRRPIVRSVFGLDDEGEGDEDDEEGETKESSPTESSLDFMKE